LLEVYGICHPGVAEHRMVGLGQANWAEIIHALLRAGYDSDLNIEGWHDPVYRDHDVEQPPDVRSHDADQLAGRKLEEAGLLVAKRTLEQYTSGTEYLPKRTPQKARCFLESAESNPNPMTQGHPNTTLLGLSWSLACELLWNFRAFFAPHSTENTCRSPHHLLLYGKLQLSRSRQLALQDQDR
jgi:hypothetical protein